MFLKNDNPSNFSERQCLEILGILPACILILLATQTGCQQEMANQARLDPLESSEVFPDRQGSRQLVVGTVPRGHDRKQITVPSRHLLSGLVNGEVADSLPPEIEQQGSSRDLLFRGKERFGVFCVPCHDVLGTGNGFVAQRGFPDPPTYHSDRLRTVPLGHLFRVISDGKGQMAAHRGQIPPEDRWAIAAFIRALQLSQHAPVESLPEEVRNRLLEKSDDAFRARNPSGNGEESP